MTDSNVTPFPGTKKESPVVALKSAGKISGRRVRTITAIPAPSSQPQGTRVENGKHTRASINRIGTWLDTIDCMRAEFAEPQDVHCEIQLMVVESILAGLVFQHKPPTNKVPA